VEDERRAVGDGAKGSLRKPSSRSLKRLACVRRHVTDSSLIRLSMSKKEERV
jgi:hypothetical protein